MSGSVALHTFESNICVRALMLEPVECARIITYGLGAFMAKLAALHMRIRALMPEPDITALPTVAQPKVENKGYQGLCRIQNAPPGFGGWPCLSAQDPLVTLAARLTAQGQAGVR